MKFSKMGQNFTSFHSHLKFAKQDQTKRTPTNQTKRKNQLLCKISFEIDGEEEELLIYQQATLDQITNQLLQKINHYQSQEDNSLEKVNAQQKKALKQEIRSKIQVTMQSCIEKNAKTEKWKKKLKEIIQQKPKTPIQSLSANATSRDLGQNRSKSIKYFNYNFFKHLNQEDYGFLDQSGENKSMEIIHRAKHLQSQLLNKVDKRELGQKTNRLYELSKRNESIKTQLMKMRQQSEEKQMFSQCTFHPNIQKIQNNNIKPNNDQKTPRNSVFKRLYKQALEKQEISKLISKQITQKQEQQLKKLNFMPKINECSKQIATLKKKIHQQHGISIYQSLYEDGIKKIKEHSPNKHLTFHPKICQASQKIIQKSRSSKTMLKNLFSSKDKIIAKRQETFQNLVTHPKNNLSKVKTQIKAKRFKQSAKNKENIPKDSKFDKISSNSRKKDLNTSTILSSKSKLDAHSQKKSQSTKKKCQKSLNQTHILTESKQQLKTYQAKNLTQSEFQKHKRKSQLDEKLNLLLINGQHSLREIDLNINKASEKKEKRKERLNPFQFFKFEDTKKQTIIKPISSEEDYHCIIQNFTNISTERKTKIFSNLFSLLNSQGREQIEASCIYKCPEIPNHIKKVLYPMAEQMQQLNVGLDYEEFIWSITRVCQSLSQKDQSQFIEWGKELDICHQFWA